jgi:ABC-2 type transport system ATP-binding protein
MTGSAAVRSRWADGAAQAGPVVRTAALVKRYGRTTALAGVDLEVRRGEVLAYLGPNGAGKTTTIRILLGLTRPTSGAATVLGRDAWREGHLVHREVGYVPAEPAVGERFTGRQQVRWTARLLGLPGEGWALEVADRLGLDLDRPARALSKGNRQKLALVLALVARPEVLILDEPTTGFDPLVQREFAALLRAHVAEGGSALLSSHVLGEVEEVADRIAVLRAGRLVAVEDMATLRGHSLHRVQARFSGPVDAADYAAVPGVRDLAVTGATLSCGVPATGLDELLRRMLASRELVDLECTEAGLEQTFLALYGAAENGE